MRFDILRGPILLPAIAVLALSVPLSSAEAASFVAGLRAPGHHPTAGRAWTIKVTARTRSGRPLRATAYYQFLYGGRVVSTQYPSPHTPPRHSPYPFRGSYKDPIVWPARAVGYRLVFRVVVHAKGRGTKKLGYWVRVRR
jgi:hypothetical protein